jgi:hypothetical protein|nr:MAG TPA: hypothetical protein [Bacteriophage sp.]
MERYLLQKSAERENWFVATDTIAGIVVKFEKGKFNDTQKATMLEDLNFHRGTPTRLATAMKELTDWLMANYSDVLQE